MDYYQSIIFIDVIKISAGLRTLPKLLRNCCSSGNSNELVCRLRTFDNPGSLPECIERGKFLFKHSLLHSNLGLHALILVGVKRTCCLIWFCSLMMTP